MHNDIGRASALTHPIDAQGKWRRLAEGYLLRAPVPTASMPQAKLAPQTGVGMIYRMATSPDPLRLRSGTGTKYGDGDGLARGTATVARTIAVLAYSPPSLALFKAKRCNTSGIAPQTDGTHVRVSATAAASPVNAKNTRNCVTYYKPSSSSAWAQAAT